MCRTSVLTPSLPASSDLIHAALAQTDERDQAEHGAGRGREHAAGFQVAAGEFRIPRQTVDLRLVHEEVEGVEATKRAIRIVAVQPGALLALGLKLVNTLLRAGAQFGDRPELDRISGAGFRAGRLQPHLHAVVAQRAFLRRPRGRVHVDHAEGAGGDAGAATVAHIRLDHDGVEFGPDDGAGGANLETARLHAMLAHVAHHQPAPVVRALELLDELDVPPVRAVELARVVVAVPAHLGHPAVRRGELIPVLAGDLAGLAADADRRVGEEPHGLWHIRLSPRYTRMPCPRESTRWDRPPRR